MRGERPAVLLVLVAACAGSKPQVTAAKARIKLVALAAESDAFPNIAKATTAALSRAKVSSVDDVTSSTVSIEVVQLSIECVDPSSACYEAAAKSLAANKLLFAQIDLAGKKPKVAVTLFDVATRAPKTAARTFETEAAAIAGVDKLVSEAIQ